MVRTRPTIFSSVALAATLLVVAFGAEAQSDSTAERLSTPRRAVDNFLRWQNPPTVDFEIASEALGTNPDLSPERREELARELKAVLDARGLFVYIEDIPDDPDYRDEATDRQTYLLFPQRLPAVELVRADDGRWLFSRATLRAIPELYGATFTGAAQWLIGHLPRVFRDTVFGVALWQLAAVFLLLLLGLVVRKTVEFFLDRLADWLVRRTPPRWDENLVRQTVKPVGFLAMTIVFLLFYRDLQFPVQVSAAVHFVLELMVSGTFIWLSFKVVDFLCEYLTRVTAKTDTKLDDQLVPMLRKTLKVFTFVVGAIAIVQSYGYSVTSIVAGLGIGGLAVALAAQDTLANLFGSITIFLDRPFQIGDWIVTGEVEGTIEEVGFRSTRIRTFYNSLVSVPNSKIANSGVDNMGLRRYRRIKEVLGLTYSTRSEQMQAFVEGIRAIIVANPQMRKDFYEVHFNGFGDFSLNVLVYCFLETDSWSVELREKHDFFLEILRLAEEVGVEFAFPTQTLHVDSFYGEKPREVGKHKSAEELAAAVRAFGPQGRLSRTSGPTLPSDGKPLSNSAGAVPSRGSE
jgi:MscS family membrane protein